MLSERHRLFRLSVLSNKNSKAQAKGKDADLAKWDAEVRKSLANKKNATVPALSKQEQNLVQVQVEKEAKIRSRMKEIKANLERALQIISHLALGSIDNLRAYVSQITSLLLRSGALDKGTLLVGPLACTTFLVWATPVPNFHTNPPLGGIRVLFRSVGYIWQMDRCCYASQFGDRRHVRRAASRASEP
jgi:hypothetical protein